jgi:uncharacterized protein (TIGR02594 family)
MAPVAYLPTTTGNPTYQLQTVLAGLGFPPGPIDGIPGVKTTQAVRNYQMSRRLVPDGVVGPKTLAALQKDGYRIVQTIGQQGGFAVKEAAGARSLLPWYDVALANIGVAEIKGPQHSPTIMGWIQMIGARALGIAVKDDETAWCGTFTAMCILRGLPGEPLPPIVVRAKSWEKFGIPLLNGSLGCVVVFDREGGGHVGFYAGEDATHIHVVGGNQGNRVSRMRLEKGRLTAYRWPSTVPRPTTGPLRLNAAGEISRDES